MQTNLPIHGVGRPVLGGRFVQGLVVMLAGWVLLWGTFLHFRSAFVVDGTIERTFISKFNWYPVPRFSITIRTGQGNEVTIEHLYGNCKAKRSGGSGRPCAVPEFPLGAAIQVEGEDVVGPLFCDEPLRPLQCGPTGFDHISSVRVDGRSVTSGWGSPLNVTSLYVLWAVAIWTLAFNHWRLATISWIQIVVFVFAVEACVIVL